MSCYMMGFMSCHKVLVRITVAFYSFGTCSDQGTRNGGPDGEGRKWGQGEKNFGGGVRRKFWTGRGRGGQHEINESHFHINFLRYIKNVIIHALTL